MDKMDDITFSRLINIEHAQHTMDAHYKITGVPSAIRDYNGELLIEVGRKAPVHPIPSCPSGRTRMLP